MTPFYANAANKIHLLCSFNVKQHYKRDTVYLCKFFCDHVNFFSKETEFDCIVLFQCKTLRRIKELNANQQKQNVLD